MNSFALDQDICNLKRECEEKDATIKELTGILQSNNMAGSKVVLTHMSNIFYYLSFAFVLTTLISDLFQQIFFPRNYRESESWRTLYAGRTQ